MLSDQVPANTLTIRLSPTQRARLQRLVRMLDTTQTEVVNEALIHLLATIELREQVHRIVPSEHEDQDRDES